MKYKEAIAQGYIIYDIKTATGYVSRKTVLDDQELKVCKQGPHAGMYYVECPNFEVTGYHDRIYLHKPEADDS